MTCHPCHLRYMLESVPPPPPPIHTQSFNTPQTPVVTDSRLSKGAGLRGCWPPPSRPCTPLHHVVYYYAFTAERGDRHNYSLIFYANAHPPTPTHKKAPASLRATRVGWTAMPRIPRTPCYSWDHFHSWDQFHSWYALPFLGSLPFLFLGPFAIPGTPCHSGSRLPFVGPCHSWDPCHT